MRYASSMSATRITRIALAAGLTLAAAACSSDESPTGGNAGSGGSPAGGTAGTASAGGTSGGAGSSAGGTAGTATGGMSGNAGTFSGGSSAGGTASGGGTGLSGKYPGDQGIGDDPAVIFHSDFESDMMGWTSYTQNAQRLAVVDDGATAHAGSKYLRANITRTMLEADQYISAQARFEFPERVDTMYWRFHTRFVGDTAVPHHWVRAAAGNASFNSDGLAGMVPGGDQGFWYDLDANDNGSFNFYVYWHEMRSWMCNDGSTDPGCAGYNGPSSNQYWGNSFNPANQTPFVRDQWFCVEIMTRANTPGQPDGELAFWIDDALVGEYKPGTPRGRWLRDAFRSHGQYFIDEQGFDGFNFRTSADVGLKAITLDAYYEKGTLDRKESNGVTVPEAQITWYDDVVVATERIGCRID